MPVSLSGGRKPLRDALYMPALVAMRFNPDLKAKYTALREAGTPAKLAIAAVMRRASADWQPMAATCSSWMVPLLKQALIAHRQNHPLDQIRDAA